MPTYTCSSRAGWLDSDRKHAIAHAVTCAHAELTGAPHYFAQVIFEDIPDGNHFVGGQPLEHEHLFIHGRIRAGRSPATREALIRRLTADVAAAARVEPFAVWVYLLELPPGAMVEFGHILPEPGAEAAWNAGLPASDRERMALLGSKPG